MRKYKEYSSEIPTMKSLSAEKSESAAPQDEPKKVIDLGEVRPADAELARADIGRERTANAVSWTKVKIEPLFEEDVDFDTFSKSDFRAVKVLDCQAVPKSTKLLQFTLDDGTDEKRVILSGIHALACARVRFRQMAA